MTYRIEALSEQDLGPFRCGNEVLDRWLQSSARPATGHGTRTYLLLDGARVVGYFAVAPHQLRRNDAPRSLARGAPTQIPALLLAKLALDRSLQGQGLGAELLLRALQVMVEAARKAGGRIVVVDSIDQQAAAFYRHHDFLPLPDQPDRLVIKLSTAAKALGLPWP